MVPPRPHRSQEDSAGFRVAAFDGTVFFMADVPGTSARGPVAPSVRAANGALSPYVQRRRQEFVARASAWLDLPEAWQVTWAAATGRESAGRARVRVDAGAQFLLELAQRDADHHETVLGHSAFGALSIVSPRGGSGDERRSVERLLKRVLTTFASRSEESFKELLAGYADVGRLEPLRDTTYRMAIYTPPVTTPFVRLGFRCNQNCDFCWQGRDWPDAPTESYEAWVDELAAAGFRSITFTGGEPTIHKQLVPLVARANRLGLRVHIQTNAIQLRKPQYLEALVAAGAHALFVSLHSHDPLISDAMTRAPRTHPLTVQGVVAGLKAGLRVELNCMVERRNAGTLAEHARFVLDEFCAAVPENPIWGVWYTHASTYFDQGVWTSAVVPMDELASPLLNAVSLLHSNGVRPIAWSACGFPPCVAHDRPELIELLDPEAMHEFQSEERSFAPVCEECAIKSRCPGVRPFYLERFGSRGLTPFDRVPDAPSMVDDHAFPELGSRLGQPPRPNHMLRVVP